MSCLRRPKPPNTLLLGHEFAARRQQHRPGLAVNDLEDSVSQRHAAALESRHAKDSNESVIAELNRMCWLDLKLQAPLNTLD